MKGSLGRIGTASSAGRLAITVSPSLVVPEWTLQNAWDSVPLRKYSLTAVERERYLPLPLSSAIS
jgi:hypothetical protein